MGCRREEGRKRGEKGEMRGGRGRGGRGGEVGKERGMRGRGGGREVGDGGDR